jgi:multidrug efflux pump subunit AcrB
MNKCYISTIVGGALLSAAGMASAAPAVCLRLEVPGASAGQIEETITNRLEKRLQALPSLKDMVSATDHDRARLQLTFKGAATAADIAAVRAVVDELRPGVALPIVAVSAELCEPNTGAFATFARNN